eukprot:superscaffoldBa00001630_g11370
MATVNPRRALVYKIQKRLCDLSVSQLLQAADSIDDGSMTDRVDEPSEPELYDLIVDYIKSEKLGALEDGGMVQLLHHDVMLSDLVAMQSEAVGVAQTAPPENEGSTTIQQGCSIPPHREPSQPTTPPATPTTDIHRHSLHMDRDIHSLPPSPRNKDAHTNPSTENRDLHTFPSPAGRGNVMLARDRTTPALAKSPTTGFGGAPPDREAKRFSLFIQLFVMAPMRNKDFKIKKHDILPSYSGGYMIEKFLGEGSFGKVALCTNLDSYKEVAVKIVCKKKAWSGKRELHMLRKLIGLDLDKNNLVKFFEHFEYREHMCLVFEMLDISLWDFMVNRSFTPLCLSEIQIIAQQLLVALKTLKNIGLVHTDIKLDNVMLVDHQWEPFKVKLIDFGLAHTASSLERGGLYQPLGYRAPDVILGLPLGEAIDMWSLGCVLALMYVGQHLYPGGCEYELLRAIMQLQGQPDDHLLRSGVKTTEYFRRVRGWFSSTWRFKTQAEYELEEGEVIEPDNIVFSSFDDLPKTRAVYKDSTESEDTESFLSLLEQMLHLDPEKRITPREALGHRFITMKHCPSNTNNKA